MAEATTIEDLRGLINESENTEPWTDVYLGGLIDAWEGTLEALASKIWTKKAATYAEMIDIQEGSSNRKLSQLHTQALSMARSFLTDESGDIAGKPRTSRTRRIERV